MDLGGEEEEKEGYLFDFRTIMKLKSIEGEMQVMGEERFGMWMERGIREAELLEVRLSFRLHEDYWMPEDEIWSMIRGALDFAGGAEAKVGNGKRVKGVVVSLEVVTVQLEGESWEGACERAVKPESLVPMIPVWVEFVPRARTMELARSLMGPCGDHMSLLRNMDKKRVEDEAEMAESCGCCGQRFVWGSQFSLLPPCLHRFHPRCLFEWLNQKKTLSPCCQLPIPEDVDY